MATLAAGTEFGAYTIEGFIAGGGMGQVYAGRNTVYGTPVAIKVLHEHLHQDEGWRLRFNLEGVIGQQLKHPHVLSARELVEQDSRVALIMDLVAGGQTLEQVMSREFPHGLDTVVAIRVFLDILQGVEYAHVRNVVHGDIKPENILIQGEFSRPETWKPKVTDFGTVGLIAHPVLIDGKTAVVATPRYASPEHLYGVDRIEPRSDIYSLGLILHYLLTGQHASTARSVKAAAVWVMGAVPLVTLVDQPDSLISVFQTATSVNADERYQTCRDFALALREVLDAMGAELELEDLTADLATEVMEERQEMRKKESVERQIAQNTEETLQLTESNREPDPQPAEDDAADLETEAISEERLRGELGERLETELGEDRLETELREEEVVEELAEDEPEAVDPVVSEDAVEEERPEGDELEEEELAGEESAEAPAAEAPAEDDTEPLTEPTQPALPDAPTRQWGLWAGAGGMLLIVVTAVAYAVFA